MAFDALVIGGGPAGSSAAIALASHGWRVALIERQSFPRDKLCGEFISPEGLGDLAHLGVLPSLREHSPSLVRRTRITLPAEQEIEIEFESPGWGLTRAVFDDVLYRQARLKGVSCFMNSQARSAHGNLGQGFQVEVLTKNCPGRIFQARALIAATGRWSNFPSPPQLTFDQQTREKKFLGIKAPFEGKVDLNEAVELHFFEEGYCGINPVEGGQINICALVNEKFGMAYAHDWDLLLTAMSKKNSQLRDRLKYMHRTGRFFITSPVLFREGEKISNDIFMVGDAAGFLDPFSGDGISIAIRSALLASNSVDRYLGGKDLAETAKQLYQSAYQQEFARRFFFARIIRRALSTGAIPWAFSKAQKKFPWLGGWVARQTRGSPRMGGLMGIQIKRD